MFVGIARIELHIPAVSSLKGKRSVVRGLKERIRQRVHAAVAEVDHQDLWQRATIAVAAVGGREYHLRKVVHEVEKFVERWAEVELIDAELSLHGPED